MQGLWLDSLLITYDGINGRNQNFPQSNFMFPGNTAGTLSATYGPWTEITAGNLPRDVRFLMTAGRFTFQAGEVRCITLGVPWARDTSGVQPYSVAALQHADDVIQYLFDNCYDFTGVGITKDYLFRIGVAPVPFHDQATVYFNNKNNESFTLTVYDMKGREVQVIKNISGNSVIVNMQGMRQGIYLFSMKNKAGAIATQKVVLE